MRHLAAAWSKILALYPGTSRGGVPRRPESPQDCVDIAGEADWHRASFRMLCWNGRDQVSRSAAAQGWAGFEPPMPRCFASAVRAAGAELVVDVGANTGFYSLLAVAVSPDIRVTAYEPLPYVRDMLAANIACSPDRDRITVLPYALSDFSGTGTLFVPDAAHGLVETSASLAATFKDGALSRQQVGVATLDALHTGAPRVAVLKVDAEGHDLQVLRGARSVLLRDRPTVFVEVLLGADEAGLTRLLNECGYLDRALRQDGQSPFGRVVVHDSQAWNHLWVPEDRARQEIPAG